MKNFNFPTSDNSDFNNLPLGPYGPIVEKAGNALADVLSDLIDDVFGKKESIDDLSDLDFDDDSYDSTYGANDEY